MEKEVEGLRQMVEDMTEKVAGLRFEDKGAETESRVPTTGVNQDREETTGNVQPRPPYPQISMQRLSEGRQVGTGCGEVRPLRNLVSHNLHVLS